MDTKKCPYCAEDIKAEAIKCKHCGEWLDVPRTDTGHSASDSGVSTQRPPRDDGVGEEVETTHVEDAPPPGASPESRTFTFIDFRWGGKRQVTGLDACIKLCTRGVIRPDTKVKDDWEYVWKYARDMHALAPYLAEPPAASYATSRAITQRPSPGAHGGQPGKHYGGIGRPGFFFSLIGLLVLTVAVRGYTDYHPDLAPVYLLVSLLIFIPVIYRLKNTGMNPWWSLLLLVPLVNLAIVLPCFACPEGYRDTKVLDVTGKGICLLVIGLFVLFAAFAAYEIAGT